MGCGNYSYKVSLLMSVSNSLERKAKDFPEKGDGPWNPARASLLKKLKRCMRRSSGSRTLTSTPASQGLSSLDSPSSPESQTGSDSDEGSEYSSGSDDDVEDDTPSPLPSSRPTDPTKALEYDALKAVWAPKNKILSADVIRSSLADYWDLMRRLRDQWKSEAALLQQAELRTENAKTAQLRDSVSEKRRQIELCIRTALVHGHRDIIERYVSPFFHFPFRWLPTQPQAWSFSLHEESWRIWKTIRVAYRTIKHVQELLEGFSLKTPSFLNIQPPLWPGGYFALC